MNARNHRTLNIIASLVAAGLLLAGAAVALRAADDAAKPHKTDWLHQAKWGVMYHYDSNWMGKNNEWDKTIDNFDVKGLAKQLHENGVGYFLITAAHASRPIAPNSVYEARNPGQCPKRDLIMDLADELAKYDIPLMLYYATGMGVPDEKTGGKIGEVTAKVIEEWSKRYGTKVKGWWLDNNVGDERIQKLLADACRAGNPDSLIAFSPPKGIRRNSKFEDYTAGNRGAPRCGGRWVDGLQWHMLSMLGRNWAACCKDPSPGISAGKAAGTTKGITDKGGVITWDTPYEVNGLVRPAYLPHLKAIGDATGTIKERAARKGK